MNTFTVSLAVKPALGTEPFTGKVVKDFPVDHALHEGHGTGKGCCFMDGGKFGLDRKGSFNYHNANPLGCFLVLVMMAMKCRWYKNPTGLFIDFDRRSGI